MKHMACNDEVSLARLVFQDSAIIYELEAKKGNLYEIDNKYSQRQLTKTNVYRSDLN